MVTRTCPECREPARMPAHATVCERCRRIILQREVIAARKREREQARRLANRLAEMPAHVAFVMNTAVDIGWPNGAVTGLVRGLTAPVRPVPECFRGLFA